MALGESNFQIKRQGAEVEEQRFRSQLITPFPSSYEAAHWLVFNDIASVT